MTLLHVGPYNASRAIAGTFRPELGYLPPTIVLFACLLGVIAPFFETKFKVGRFAREYVPELEQNMVRLANNELPAIYADDHAVALPGMAFAERASGPQKGRP